MVSVELQPGSTVLFLIIRMKKFCSIVNSLPRKIFPAPMFGFRCQFSCKSFVRLRPPCSVRFKCKLMDLSDFAREISGAFYLRWISNINFSTAGWSLNVFRQYCGVVLAPKVILMLKWRDFKRLERKKSQAFFVERVIDVVDVYLATMKKKKPDKLSLQYWLKIFSWQGRGTAYKNDVYSHGGEISNECQTQFISPRTLSHCKLIERKQMRFSLVCTVSAIGGNFDSVSLGTGLRTVSIVLLTGQEYVIVNLTYVYIAKIRTNHASRIR